MRTNFRMPDVISLGIGGGSIVHVDDEVRVGPTSVGHRLTERALVFGGATPTATDVAVAGGIAEIGDPTLVEHLDRGMVREAIEWIHARVGETIDRIKTEPEPIPVVLVGGGSVLLTDDIPGASRVVRPDYFPVANAIGAAIAKVGGQVDRVVSLEVTPRAEALAAARAEAIDRCVASGAAAGYRRGRRHRRDPARLSPVERRPDPSESRRRPRSGAGCDHSMRPRSSPSPWAPPSSAQAEGGSLHRQADGSSGARDPRPHPGRRSRRDPGRRRVRDVGGDGGSHRPRREAPGRRRATRRPRALEVRLGTPVTHIICAEVGGLNSTLPIVAAAATGLPLVDCDAMGRAFPEIQMSTPTLFGVEASPMALADDKGNMVVVDAIDNRWTERLARSITIDMGAAAFIALYVQPGAQVKEGMIAGTLALAESVGAAVLEARRIKTDPVIAAARRLGGIVLFEGKIVDVSGRTVAGFARGRVVLEGVDRRCRGNARDRVPEREPRGVETENQ